MKSIPKNNEPNEMKFKINNNENEHENVEDNSNKSNSIGNKSNSNNEQKFNEPIHKETKLNLIKKNKNENNPYENINRIKNHKNHIKNKVLLIENINKIIPGFIKNTGEILK